MAPRTRSQAAAEARTGFCDLPVTVLERIAEMAAPLGELKERSYLHFTEASMDEAAARYETSGKRLTRTGFILGTARVSKLLRRAAHHLAFRHIVITRMDQAYRWVSRIPEDKYVLRRVVGARSLVHPMTGRYLYSWRRLGTAIGADHKAVQRWHAQGIDMIVGLLNR